MAILRAPKAFGLYVNGTPRDDMVFESNDAAMAAGFMMATNAMTDFDYVVFTRNKSSLGRGQVFATLTVRNKSTDRSKFDVEIVVVPKGKRNG